MDRDLGVAPAEFLDDFLRRRVPRPSSTRRAMRRGMKSFTELAVGMSSGFVWTDVPNSGVTIFPYESSTATPRVDSLSVVVRTYAPERNDLVLVVPDDYAGIYNVTSDGNVYRRYVGEPRFLAVVFNGTTTKATILVPRSVFFDTRRYADLEDAPKLGDLPTRIPHRRGRSSASSSSCTAASSP